MQWHTLPARARTLFYIQSFLRLFMFWIPVTVVAASALAAWWSVTMALLVAGVWLMIRFLVSAWWPAMAWSRWAWANRGVDLLVASGVIFRSIVAIPTQRIQHVDVQQGPLEQWLGLARVRIYTASGMGADGVIPGLELQAAEALRDELVSVEGDDGV